MRVDHPAIVASTCHYPPAMARSTTTYLHKREGHPAPELPDEPLIDRYYSSEDSDVSTPTQRSENAHHYSWSDDTLTGSLTGRSSVDSWAGEYELDRITTDRVARLFNNISKALYDGRSTGQPQVDAECKEWSSKFPHFQVQGAHLLDSYDDGTEMVSSTYASAKRDLDDSVVSVVGFNSIAVIGHKIHPVVITALPDVSDTSDLYEEIIASDGVIEESFAFDNTDEDPLKKKRQSRMKHHSRLPPITPIACVRDTVQALVFDQLWEEVVGALQPLLAAVETKLRAEYSGGHISSHSSAMNEALLLADPYLPSPYVLRPPEHSGFRLADEQSSYQMILKRTTLVPLPTLPLQTLHSSLLPQKGLEGVMKIKSFPLHHRPQLPNETMDSGTIGPTDSMTTYSRLLGKNTPVVQRISEPTSRLISGGRPPPGTKRNTALKPLDKPRTPSLALIDNGIRGHRLHTASTVSQSPLAPPLRNTQLPPLDVTEQMSPPVQRASAQRGSKVTFSRGLGTADTSGEPWHLPKSIVGGDMRPNTSRDSSSRTMQRKNSDHTLHFPAVVMKVVGHATGVGGAFAGGVANTIVEDEEEGYNGVVNSSYAQPKPKSSRGKLRGHVR